VRVAVVGRLVAGADTRPGELRSLGLGERQRLDILSSLVQPPAPSVVDKG
jgi:hypothetical protein